LADNNDANDPISEKKLKQLDGEYSTTKTILGFDFDRVNKTLWLEEAKRAHLLTVLHGLDPLEQIRHNWHSIQRV
jgi:prolyl-tRNA editing enzyme YbaK/EbsC (Cys-tRNA(Pro) deacylase)